MHKTSTLFILLFLSCTYGRPQSRTDTTFLISAKENALQLHQQALRSQARLYNGSKYRAPQQTFEEHPNLASEDWITGSVFYDGELFQDVSLIYDVTTDVLVTDHFPSGHPIQLISDKIDYFTLGNRLFERIGVESVNNSLPRTGFYEILYDGATKVVALRQKLRREKIESTRVFVLYESRDRYFLFRNGVFFPVKSKSSILKLLEDRKQELKRFIKQRNLLISSNRELTLKSLAEYYDTLQ
jgi:hypothetical protein